MHSKTNIEILTLVKIAGNYKSKRLRVRGTQSCWKEYLESDTDIKISNPRRQEEDEKCNTKKKYRRVIRICTILSNM
jgi:hypothetical protein